MSKSFDFCVKRASDKTVSGYAGLNWTKAKEQQSEEIFQKYIGQAKKIVLTDKDCRELTAIIEFNPEADFDYFTSKQIVHDGTWLFVLECFEDIVKKIVKTETYYVPKGPHDFGDTVKYTIGNFVWLEEYGDNFGGEKWMNSRTTVLLPLKYERISNVDKKGEKVSEDN